MGRQSARRLHYRVLRASQRIIRPQRREHEAAGKQIMTWSQVARPLPSSGTQGGDGGGSGTVRVLVAVAVMAAG